MNLHVNCIEDNFHFKIWIVDEVIYLNIFLNRHYVSGHGKKGEFDNIPFLYFKEQIDTILNKLHYFLTVNATGNVV